MSLTLLIITYYISMLKVLSVTPWGSDSNSLLVIVEVYRVSRLQYGSQAFGKVANQITTLCPQFKIVPNLNMLFVMVEWR